jgi:hypothetical protein
VVVRPLEWCTKVGFGEAYGMVCGVGFGEAYGMVCGVGFGEAFEVMYKSGIRRSVWSGVRRAEWVFGGVRGGVVC